VITGMNHAVLYVRDARRQQRFYEEVLGFETVVADPGGAYVFMRAPGSGNHHDLACFTDRFGRRRLAGRTRARSGCTTSPGRCPTLDDLEEHRRKLAAAGALKGASDHGVNKSLYAHDPDGIEFEVMWLVPPDEWGEAEHQAIVQPLDIAGDAQRFGGDRWSSTHRSAGPAQPPWPRADRRRRRPMNVEQLANQYCHFFDDDKFVETDREGFRRRIITGDHCSCASGASRAAPPARSCITTTSTSSSASSCAARSTSASATPGDERTVLRGGDVYLAGNGLARRLGLHRRRRVRRVLDPRRVRTARRLRAPTSRRRDQLDRGTVRSDRRLATRRRHRWHVHRRGPARREPRRRGRRQDPHHTESNPLDGVRTGVGQLLAKAGVSPADVTAPIVHATTLITNALIEGKTGRAGWSPPPASATRCSSATSTATTCTTCRSSSRRRRSRAIARSRSSSAPAPPARCSPSPSPSSSTRSPRSSGRWTSNRSAVCFLNAYVNAANERVVAAHLARARRAGVHLGRRVAADPRVPAHDHHGVQRRHHAGDRPVPRRAPEVAVGRGLRRLGADDAVERRRGVGRRCGRVPIRLVESGPAAGALAGSWFARRLGEDRLLCFDMGGTTAKACLIDQGEPELTNVFEVARVYRFKKGSGFPCRCRRSTSSRSAPAAARSPTSTSSAC
jgi:catechol 2,3-dioxygenase-like lactoylglutathione lyase family enzyme